MHRFHYSISLLPYQLISPPILYNGCVVYEKYERLSTFAQERVQAVSQCTNTTRLLSGTRRTVGSPSRIIANSLFFFFQKLLRLDCTPQALLELFHQQIDELLDNTPLVQDHIGPNITSEPSKQTMNFSFPLIKINSSDKTDVMDIFTNGFLFSTHPQQWLQSSTFANDVVIHGVFGALGYIDITK